MQTTDFVATVFDGTSNPNKVTVTFTMALNALDLVNFLDSFDF